MQLRIAQDVSSLTLARKVPETFRLTYVTRRQLRWQRTPVRRRRLRLVLDRRQETGHLPRPLSPLVRHGPQLVQVMDRAQRVGASVRPEVRRERLCHAGSVVNPDERGRLPALQVPAGQKTLCTNAKGARPARATTTTGRHRRSRSGSGRTPCPRRLPARSPPLDRPRSISI